MVLKILALAALALAVWWITRSPPAAVGKADDDGNNDGNTELVQCGKCGVYHAVDKPCGCEK